jgi:diguanylate cyclase (GGDEF)-like protein
MTRESLRSSDLVYRYGGDEFVIMMPNAGLAAAIGVAEKIRRNIDSVEFKLSKTTETTVKVTLSMGVAEIESLDHAESFFARADKAMYQAKSAGRNRVSSAV